MRDGGGKGGCLLVKERDVTEVQLWLLRKTQHEAVHCFGVVLCGGS